MIGCPITTYDAAIDCTTDRRRALLLGNGFSIGIRQAFGYPSLYADALAADPSLGVHFEREDPNFETALRNAPDGAAAGQIRQALIKAVAGALPQSVLHISVDERKSCRDFLLPFLGRDLGARCGRVFSTNYDLLLHWVLSSQGKTPGTKQETPLDAWDGFTRDGEWRPGGDAHVYYLHGAVHIFETKDPQWPRKRDIAMLRYQRGATLKQQVEARLARSELPAFVAEAEAQQKTWAQDRFHYLKKAKREFEKVCADPDGVLFTFGHSFGSSDNHIADAVGAGAVRRVFIGTYGPADIEKAGKLAECWAVSRRDRQTPIEVQMFDAKTCRVWNRYSDEQST